MDKNIRKMMRSSCIKARNSLSTEDRTKFSVEIINKLIQSEEFINAKNILIYRGVKGEVKIDDIIKEKNVEGKTFAYPLCVSSSNMVACVPNSEESWKAGAYNIPEPILEDSHVLEPEAIDLVICPCTAFDEECNRMGMGAGYYDRFLAKCQNADIVSVAFEVQKVDHVIVDSWDKPMKKTFTEIRVYSRVEEK